MQSSLKKLHKEAIIVLLSCSTAGDPADGGKNIAKHIAQYADGRKVVAASKEVCFAETYIDPETLETKFFNSGHGIINKIKGVAGSLLFQLNLTKSLYFHEDVTRIYQSTAA